jgi:hypothetical protein
MDGEDKPKIKRSPKVGAGSALSTAAHALAESRVETVTQRSVSPVDPNDGACHESGL